MGINLRAAECHQTHGIIQCLLSPDTGERARLNLNQASQYTNYLPRRDGRLS